MIVWICAGAVRRWLIEHDELPTEPLVAQIPVSVRTKEQQGTFGNRILLMTAPLYTDEADPFERLQVTHEILAEMKARHKALPAELLEDATSSSRPRCSRGRRSSRSRSAASQRGRPAMEPRGLQRPRAAVPDLLAGAKLRPTTRCR